MSDNGLFAVLAIPFLLGAIWYTVQLAEQLVRWEQTPLARFPWRTIALVVGWTLVALGCLARAILGRPLL